MALLRCSIDHAWVTDLCRDLASHSPGAVHDVEVRAFELTPLASDQGVLSRYEPSADDASDHDRALVGHHLLTIDALVDDLPRPRRLVLKAKVPGAVVRRRMADVYRKLDRRLAEAQQRVSPSILDDCHTRELHVYAQDRASLRSITPAIARVWLDEPRQIFAVVMELLEGVRHARTLNQLDVWLERDITCALTQLARVHGDFLAELEAAPPPPWLLPFASLHHEHLLAYQAELLRYNAETFPELFGAARVRILEALLASAGRRHQAILARPLTLIHGDFTPRNLCLKTGPTEALRLCAYDWELAQLHLPQRDVCELLCYVLPAACGWSAPATARMLEHYRAALVAAAGRPIDAADFEHDLALALAEFCTFKLLVQGITHQRLGHRSYFERLVHNAFDGLAAFAAAAG
jgi:hypothetical protein